MAENVQVILEAILDSRGFTAGTDQVKKQLGDVKDKNESTLGAIKTSWIAITASIVAAWALVKEAISLTKEFSELDEASQQMMNRFGVDANKVVAALKDISDGTISTKDAVLLANKAMAMGVTTDITQITQLYKIAAMQGKTMGIDASQAFDMLVTAIGRGAPRMLNSLGLYTDGLKAMTKGTDGTVKSSLFLNTVLEENQGLIKAADQFTSFEDSIKRTTVKLDELKERAGKNLGVIFENPFNQDKGADLTDFMSDMITGFSIAVVYGQSLFQKFIDTTSTGFQQLAFEAKGIGTYMADLMAGDFAQAGQDWKKFREDDELINLAYNQRMLLIDKQFADQKKKILDPKQFDINPAKARSTAKRGGNVTPEKTVDDDNKETQELMRNAEKLANAEAAAMARSVDNDLKARKQKFENAKEYAKKGVEIADALQKYEDQKSANRITILEKQMAKELSIQGLTANQKKDIEEKYTKKINEEKLKQAKIDKGMAIFHAVISMGEGIAAGLAKGLPLPGIPLAAMAATLGGIQIATAAATPLPTFAFGGRPGGLSLVGEQGPELFQPDTPGTIISNQLLAGISMPSLIGSSHGGGVVNNTTNDNASREYHFHGIPDIEGIRNALMRHEGPDAFVRK